MDMDLTETIATLKGVNPGPSGTGVRFVKGYYAAGDAGAGIFEWDAASTLEDNGGTVIKPTEASTGRWIRQFDVRGPVHAEWFGAQGDGSTADHVAIQACLTHFNRVTLLARQYVLNQQVLVPAGSIVEGQGIDKTIVISKVTYAGQPVLLAAFRSDPPSDADGAVVRDLTVDCWFTEADTESQKYHTRAAVRLTGSGVSIERVKAVNFGAGYNPGTQSGKECFVLFACNSQIGLAARRTKGNVIRDCIITAPGTRADALSTHEHFPEITCLTVGGQYADSAPTVLAEGGAIAGNRVYDINYQPNTSPYQYSSPHAITVANCRGTEIADNEVINCDGVGAYVVSWTDEAVVIRNNRFLGVNVGINVGVIASEVTGGLYPSHSGMRIEENLILLGRNTHLLSSVNGTRGIVVYAGGNIEGEPLLKDISIARNFVRGDAITEGQTTYYALGVQLWLQSPIFESLNVCDNVLEVPDADALNTAYENALLFNPTYRAVDPATGVGGKVRAHGNRNLSGQDMRFKYQQYQQDQEMVHWGPHSQRLARFKAPSFGGRAGVFYDEFMGQLPRSAWGWQGVTTNNGSISEYPVDTDNKGPGIAKLSTGATSNGTAMLRTGTTAYKLGGNLRQVFQCKIRRFEVATQSENYEFRFGLLRLAPASDDGVYIKIKWFGDTDPKTNCYLGVCMSGGTSATAPASKEQSADWTTLGIEVVPDASKVLFFRDGASFGEATTNIPLSELGLAFRVAKLSGTAERYVKVDYCQHLLI